MYVRIAITALLTLMLSITGLSAGNAAEADVMTKKRAGEYYLTQICSSNKAATRFSRAMFRGAEFVSAKQLRGERLRRTKKAALRASNVEYRVARRLLNSPAAWPQEVERKIARKVDNLMVTSDRFGSIAGAAGAQQVFRRYDRLGKAWSAGVRISKRIRLALNLPRNGC